MGETKLTYTLLMSVDKIVNSLGISTCSEIFVIFAFVLTISCSQTNSDSPWTNNETRFVINIGTNAYQLIDAISAYRHK